MSKTESNNKARHTIRDIARVTGVSPKTVSFVLNDREGVADQTRKRVLKAVKEMEYHPHAADRVVPRLHERGVPYVAVTRLDSFPQCSAASVDYEQAAYLSTRHLLERGHTRIGLIKAFRGYQSGLERRRGYERALQEAGLPVDESLIRPVTFDSHSIVNSVHALLSDRSVTALIDTSSTEDPVVLREGARRAGRRFGTELEIVVWTYRYDTVVLPEACAHMCLPLRQASAEGLEHLAAWIEGRREGPIQLLYQPTLLETPREAPFNDTLRVFHETG